MSPPVGSWGDVACGNPRAAPSSRSGHACVVFKDFFYVFGGAHSLPSSQGEFWRDESRSVELNDLHEFSFAQKQWRVVPATGRPPSARSHHSCVVFQDSLFVFGGHHTGRNALNDLIEYNFGTRMWRVVVVNAGDAPSPRYAHAAVVYDQSMYCFGGYTTAPVAATLGDFHEFNFETRTWTPVRATGTAPQARQGSSLVVFENSCILFGGYAGGSGRLCGVHLFDFDQRMWSTIVTLGPAPLPRDAHVAVIHSDAMYVFGGIANKRMNDMYKLPLGSSDDRSWELITPTGATPSACSLHAAAVYDSSLIVFGGDGNVNNFRSFRFEEPKTVPKASPVPQSSLLADLRNLVNNELTSDVTFIVEGSPIYGHKMLCVRCEYFRAMFTGDMLESRAREVVISDVRRPIFLQFLEYLYTDEIEVSIEDATEMLMIADRYGVDRLKLICENHLQLSLAVDTVATILYSADLHNATALREQCVRFILDNFDTVSKTAAFVEMSRTNVELVLELLRLR